MLFTHDHYDHLDFASVQKLKGKVKHFFVALGMKRHLQSWGISADKITEFENKNIKHLIFICDNMDHIDLI